MAKLSEIEASKEPDKFHGQCKQDIGCARCPALICNSCVEWLFVPSENPPSAAVRVGVCPDCKRKAKRIMDIEGVHYGPINLGINPPVKEFFGF